MSSSKKRQVAADDTRSCVRHTALDDLTRRGTHCAAHPCGWLRTCLCISTPDFSSRLRITIRRHRKFALPYNMPDKHKQLYLWHSAYMLRALHTDTTKIKRVRLSSKSLLAIQVGSQPTGNAQDPELHQRRSCQKTYATLGHRPTTAPC